MRTQNLKNNEAGFGAVEAVLVLVIVILVVGIGVFAYKHNSKPAAKTTPVASQAAQKNAVDPYAGWKTATLKQEKLSFKYPSQWKLTNYGSTQYGDDIGLTNSDGLSISISTGSGANDFQLPSGGEQDIFDTPVTFAGRSAWLVSYNGKKDGQVMDTELSSQKTIFSNGNRNFFKAKNTKGNGSTPALVTVGISDGKDMKPLQSGELKASTSFQQAVKIVDSMRY